MTALEFIATVHADACTHGKPDPMTEQEAQYTMDQWKHEGFCYPEWLTASAFAACWNYLNTL